MQSVTRNPLAEPGLLGVNAGAAMAVVLGSIAFGLTSVSEYIWFSMLGAGLSGGTVFLLGQAQDSGTDPVRLVLAGAGLSMLLGALTTLLILNADLEVLDLFRNWGTGTLDGRGADATMVAGLSLLVGGALVFLIAPALDALAMGQDIGRTLGLDPRRIWALALSQRHGAGGGRHSGGRSHRFCRTGGPASGAAHCRSAQYDRATSLSAVRSRDVTGR